MSKTVYIEVVSNYSRTDWSIDGSTTYQPGDRVAYFDGSRNRIFVCINSNNSTTEPQNNPTDWAPAGSEKYPFLNIDSTSNMRAINSSEWIVHGRSSDTVNFLAEELGTWTADNPVGGNAVYIADGQGGTIILGDGRYAWDQPTYAMWWPSNCTIKAKNKQKAYIISSGNYWAGDNVTWKDIVIYCSNAHNNIPGGYNGYSHSLDSCLITQETPWGSLYPQKQEPSEIRWSRPIGGLNGGYVRNCVFDYQYRGPSYWFDFKSGSTGIFENNTFYARVKHNQYNAAYHGQAVIFKNNIFYFKYLMDGHASQSFSIGLMITNGVNVFYLENDSNVGGTLTNNIPEGITINPEFVDAGNSNFSLRPSSPLIGGVKEGNSNPAGVYIQPGSSTGGSGTFEDPYYMAELDTAETEAAAGNSIIYFVDGEYEISGSLNFYADGITYKSLNKHKAILGSSDTNITSAKQINIGGKWGTTGLDVGNITLEDFYIKNTRFQQVSNSSSRPNKIKGLKAEETHPITHGTDGFLWSGGGKFIIESCFIYVNFGFESAPYLTRGTSTSEILNTTLIINFPQTSGHVTFVTFGSIENSIIYATTEIPESGFSNLTANSKNCCFYNIGSNIIYGGENTYQGDPKFVDPNSKDFRLRANSPLIGGAQTYSESASEWYVDLVNGDDANDGKTRATAMLTVAAAHTASINRDTIYIVNQELTLSSNLTLPGGRDYKPASYCNIDGSNAYGIILSDTGALETGLNNFNFTNLRGSYSLLSIEASTSLSVFKIESCNFQGTIINNKSAAIGGSSLGSCRGAADGSELKNCAIDCTWGAASTAGNNSSGFVAVDRMNLIGCTFHVGKNTPISDTLYLVGSGGYGSWSHGPPFGPVLVKNCIVYGNEKMTYSRSGNGSSFGFVSNAKVTTNSADYLIHNTCIYGVRGTFGIDEADTPYKGSLITEYLSGPEDIIIYDFDPKLVSPSTGDFSLRPNSPLIGKG